MSQHDRASYMRDRFGRSQRFVNWREQRHVAKLLAGLERPLSRVLDIPCGHGRFTSQLRAVTASSLVCSDISVQPMQALAEAEGEGTTPITLRQADLFSRLPFEDREFDLVFDFRFFHHVHDNEKRRHVASELVRVSGRYLIVSYYHRCLVHALQKPVWRALRGQKRKIVMVPRARFLEIFERLGCRVASDWAVLPFIHAHRVALFER